jgi:hypothetical protein
MKIFCILLSAVLLGGCAGKHPRGVSRYDAYDAVKVDQMVGNNVSQTILAKTVVCLNARRESRLVTAITNVTITSVTNRAVLATTNQTISIATNYLVSTMTNLAPLAPPTPIVPTGDAAAPGTETNALAAVTNTAPAVTTNVSVSLALNQSASFAPGQNAANSQSIRSYNNQLTTTSNNVSVSVMTNQVITAETNQVVFYTTNMTVAPVTNVVITPTNLYARDYFLYTELIPPSDFSLQSGESLVLLVDGVRHGFTQGQSGTAFVARKGYTSALYRVPPEVLVAISNAKEVKVRFKGTSSVIERTMNGSSRRNFRKFLLNYFNPEPETKTKVATAASAQLATR